MQPIANARFAEIALADCLFLCPHHQSAFCCLMKRARLITSFELAMTVAETTNRVFSAVISFLMLAAVDLGAPASGVQSIAVTFKDAGGGVAATGIEVDGQVVSEVPAPERRPCPLASRRPGPASSPATVATTLQFNPASVPDGAHQLREVFARDATGANVGYSAGFPVTTSARGAINGTNGSDQVRLSVSVRAPRAQRPGRSRPHPLHTTLDVPATPRPSPRGGWSTARGKP